MPTDLKGLIERVESGANDRNLDLDIIAALSQDGDVYPALPGIIIRALQGSVDAVLALIEAKLPGWAIAEMKNGIRHEDGPYCHVRLWCPVNSALGYKYPSNAPTPARAALAAALRAIQDSRHDR